MGINFGTIDAHVRRYAKAAQEHGYLEEPTAERMVCACGYHGQPEAIIRHSEWDASETDRDTFICPQCGDA